MSTFCKLPWLGLNITTQGQYSPCCKYQLPVANNLNDYVNSEHRKQLQKDFENNLKPVGCERCWQEEAAGLQSLRQYYRDHVDMPKDPVANQFAVLHLTFGNICNLACRTCNSYLSSKWSVEEKKLGLPAFQHTTFYKQSEFLAGLKSVSHDVIHLTFSGGEVFYTGVTEHLDYLDHLISHNPQQIQLQYITNATIFPDQQFWDRWTRFKKVTIELSIDAVGSKFEYLRYPASWSQCYNNIKAYQNNTNLIELAISHTVSFFNVFYLDEFYIWCLKEKLPAPYINMVHDPTEFNPAHLPITVKSAVINKLSKYRIFDAAVEFLSLPVSHDVQLPHILNKVTAVDQLRNQDFVQTFPEFAKLLVE